MFHGSRLARTSQNIRETRDSTQLCLHELIRFWGGSHLTEAPSKHPRTHRIESERDWMQSPSHPCLLGQPSERNRNDYARTAFRVQSFNLDELPRIRSNSNWIDDEAARTLVIACNCTNPTKLVPASSNEMAGDRAYPTLLGTRGIVHEEMWIFGDWSEFACPNELASEHARSDLGRLENRTARTVDCPSPLL